MKRAFFLLSSLLTILALVAPASAAIVLFQDNFDTENGGNVALNYTGFANWVVTGGTVDLIGTGSNGTGWDYRPGNGLYVDMDGTSNNAGILTTRNSFNLSAGTYVLSFWLSGSTLPSYGATDSVEVRLTVAGFTETLTLNAADPFTQFQRTISLSGPVTGAQISFEGIGGNNVGLLLDNVTFSQVPLPAAAWLLGTGLLGLVVIKRKKRA